MKHNTPEFGISSKLSVLTAELMDCFKPIPFKFYLLKSLILVCFKKKTHNKIS